MPRITRFISNDNLFRYHRVHTVLKQFSLQRQLGYKTTQDVFDTITKIDISATALIEQQARGLWLTKSVEALLRKKMLPVASIDMIKYMSYPDETTNDAACYFIWVTSADNGTGIKYGVSCICGEWDDTRTLINRGKLIEKSLVQYDGEWQDLVPNGRGKSYYPSGNLQVDGVFLMGQPHGECKVYHEDGKTLQAEGMWEDGSIHGQATSYHKNGVPSFIGTYEAAKEVHGTWFDSRGTILCQGDVSVYAEMMERQNKVLHQCTFPLTGDTYALQTWYHCDTCFGENVSAGVCVACAMRCHKDHILRENPPSTFFCDCGSHDKRSVECVALEPCSIGCSCIIITREETSGDDENEEAEAEAEAGALDVD
jgi:hypothetical protein